MKRAEDIQVRLDNVRQVESIVATLRALAAAHRAEARTHLQAIHSHETVVASALAAALSALADKPHQESANAQDIVIIVGVSQGFCGVYADQLAQAVQAEVRQGATLMVIGARTAAALEGGETMAWTADMAAHAYEVPGLASRLADALFARLVRTPGTPVRVVVADPTQSGLPLTSRQLLPFDFSRVTPLAGPQPLITLPPATLAMKLVEEYVFAELCRSLMMGFAAENAARAEAMARAQSNTRRILTELQSEFRRVRQEQMTTEIIEVSAGR